MQEAKYNVDLDRTANKPIPEGIHNFVVTEIAEGESKVKEDGSGGNPMWTVTSACTDPGEEGKTVRMFLVLTDAARWKFENFLDAVKAPLSGSAVAAQFIGKKFRAQIQHTKYEGKDQANIGEMFPSSSNAPLSTPAVRPAAKPIVAAKPVTPSPAPKAAAKPKVNTPPADVAGSEIPF